MPLVDTQDLTIKQLQQWGTAQLTESDSAVLDVRILLCHCLQCEPVYLMTWPDKSVSQDIQRRFYDLIGQRKIGHPIAHLIGYRDFWTLQLKVSPATLIPRPETELLIESALNLALPDNAKVLDLGTGTGAIALALASERPDWNILGIDKSMDAVELAKQNGLLNDLSAVKFQQSDWFSSLEGQHFDLIISNPPYVEHDSRYLQDGDVRFEPLSALISGPDGLDDIRYIIKHCQSHLTAKGWLLLEHGHQQGLSIRTILAQANFQEIITLKDLNQLDRVSLAMFHNCI